MLCGWCDCVWWSGLSLSPAGEQLLLLARGGGGGCGLWETEGDPAEGHQPWRLCAEEDAAGGGQAQAQDGLPAPGSHPGAANELASAGAAPPLGCALPRGPPEPGPEELLQQTHCSHVQVRGRGTCAGCARELMAAHLPPPPVMVSGAQEHSCASTPSWSG